MISGPHRNRFRIARKPQLCGPTALYRITRTGVITNRKGVISADGGVQCDNSGRCSHFQPAPTTEPRTSAAQMLTWMTLARSMRMLLRQEERGRLLIGIRTILLYPLK